VATARIDAAAEDGAHSRQLVGQMAAALFVACGLITAVSPLLPAPPGMDKLVVVLIGVVAAFAGLVVWFLPWDRWPRSRSIGLAPLALTLIAVHNHFGGADPYRYGLFFVVAFVWLGIAHPPRTSLLVAPLLVAAYIAPLFTSGRATAVTLASAVYVVPVCLLVAETMAWATERLRRAQQEVGRSEARFRSLVQSGTDVIVVLDADSVVRYLSPSSQRVTGYLPEEIVGSDGRDSVHPDDLPTLRAVIANLLARPSTHPTFEVRLRHRDGSWRTMEAVAANKLDDPAVTGLVINARDVTDRKALEAQLLHQAFRDSLTGLANRALFLDRLEHASVRVHRGAESLAVLFVDLDDFKLINDSLGHEAGDDLLRQTADRLRECVRTGDTVARLGGDEFTVLLEGIESMDEPLAIAARIGERLAEPVRFGEREVVVRASVGIALLTAESVAPLEVLRRADVAMYAAKRSGKGRYAVHQSRMDEPVRYRLGLEGDLRRALTIGELEMHYQPIVDLATGECREVEALVRWRHPERGLLPPGAFVPFAEEHGLIVPLGRWVLETACAQWRAWQSADPSRCLPVVGVNLSGRQLEHPDIVGDIAQVLETTGFPPSQLKLEITESVALDEVEAAIAHLAELRVLGIRLAVDDFGTGYAGLRSLRHCPVDTLKIDRQFVAALGRDASANTVVSAVLEFAHRLGLSATAEGVETEEQAAVLRALGCERGQGFLFGRPGVLESVGPLLDTRDESRSLVAEATAHTAAIHPA
jgi:diguanylate cyclase (GGDEF)-like protein/PAS domain S-box-containing protein